MRRPLSVFAILVCCAAAFAGDPPKRPRIFGIARVKILASDVSRARSFYSKVLNQAHDCNWCEGLPGRSFTVNLSQGITLLDAPSPAPSNMIDEIDFTTDNIAELRRYLTASKITVTKSNKPQDNYLSLNDPEGHRIGFMQRTEIPALNERQNQSLHTAFPLRIIHAGIIVHNQAAEDRFYKDVLGFHLYWHGGMKEGEDHWIDMQVPDGTDWL